MYIELIEKRILSAEVAGLKLEGLEVESEWEGLTKLVQPGTDVHLIVMREEGLVVNGSKSIMDRLLAPTTEPGYLYFPRTTLPCGRVVEAFQIAQYNNCVDAQGKAYVSEKEKPRVRINFADSRKACQAAGGDLITGSQHLAIAWDIVNQDENWSGGKVGQGKVYRGLHKGNVSGAVTGDYETGQQDERRWHVLSTGDRIYDFAGHLWSWMFDEIHGNAEGLPGKIPADSPYLTTGSQFAYEQGMGYRPDGERDWSGVALVRGGGWGSGARAGVFRLDDGWPGGGDGNLGFRCTKPVGL